jgi:arginyl-tRNA synthetase
MLCALIEKKVLEVGTKGKTSRVPVKIEDLDAFYKAAQKIFETDNSFAERSRTAIAQLHSGNSFWLGRWRRIIDESRKHYQPIYDILGVALHKENERGESFYRGMLGAVVKDLKKAGIAVESDGAICVFPPGFKNKDGDDLPFIIQKSDGAYLYATTDLAAIRYRAGKLKADKIVYVTDARQKLHFEMLFSAAQMAKWAMGIELSHVMFPRKKSRPACRKESQNRKGRRYRRDQIRRLLQQPHERLRIQLQQDARHGRQHRPIHAIRLRPHKIHRTKGNRKRRGQEKRA